MGNTENNHDEERPESVYLDLCHWYGFGLRDAAGSRGGGNHCPASFSAVHHRGDGRRGPCHPLLERGPWRRKGPTSGSASTIRASWRRSSRGTSSSSPSTSHNTR